MCLHITLKSTSFILYTPGIPVIAGKQFDDTGDNACHVLVRLKVLAELEDWIEDEGAGVAELKSLEELGQDLVRADVDGEAFRPIADVRVEPVLLRVVLDLELFQKEESVDQRVPEVLPAFPKTLQALLGVGPFSGVGCHLSEQSKMSQLF